MELGKIEPDQQPSSPSAPVGILSEMGLRSRLYFGIVVIGVFFGGFGVWAGFAPLQTGAIAAGSINVAGQRKTLQHLEGGIVDSLLVKEGERIKKGQVLIRLSDTQALAQIQLLWGQLSASLAASSRLKAERDNNNKISFDPDILNLLGGDEAKHNEILEGQLAIFSSRRETLQSQRNLTRQRVRQLREEIKGLRAEIKSQDRQLSLIKEEITDLSVLLEKGYARKPRMLELRREDAALQGTEDQNISRIARAKQAIVEAELGLVEIKAKMMSEVVTELRETQQQIADLRERVTASEDILSRMEIRAPVSGRVVDLQIYTNGGVIAPGAPITSHSS